MPVGTCVLAFLITYQFGEPLGYGPITLLLHHCAADGYQFKLFYIWPSQLCKIEPKNIFQHLGFVLIIILCCSQKEDKLKIMSVPNKNFMWIFEFLFNTDNNIIAITH